MERKSANARRVRRAGASLGAALAVAAVVGYGTSGAAADHTSAHASYGFTAPAQSSGTLTVWVDSTRLPIAKAYQAAHPSVKLNIVTYDGDANGSNSYKTKTELFDRSKSGWPDVAFTADNNSASWGAATSAGGTGDLAPLNKGLVPASTLNNFAKGSLSVCTVGGMTYCLRNDLAQNLLWYNAKLMKKFGYTVPTTWEQYQALSAKVARQHPGYIMGTAGDAWSPEIYMWGAQCPASDVTGAKAITVNTADANCVKAAKMMDTMIGNKTMSTLSLFGPEFAKQEASKVLMLPGPSWYGVTLFDDTLKVPAGQVAAAKPLTWANASQKVTGDVGGGAWWISSHSTHLAAAENFITWVTAQGKYGSSPAPGYPAYVPAAKAWLAATQKSKYFANNISPAILASAGMVWTGWTPPAFSQESVWAQAMQPGINSGKSIVSMLPAWGTAIANQAQVNGYTVSK
jgi:multiple sugar transport system substrate-binding protein